MPEQTATLTTGSQPTGHEGKVALVTGGATGIGRATCLELARRGVGRIQVGYGSSTVAADELCAELSELGATAGAIRIEVSDRDHVRQACDAMLAEVGGLDILVNNAGTTVAKPFDDLASITPDLWQQLLEVNVMGAFWLCQALEKPLRERRGSIVNVTSIAGTRAVGSSLPYGVTKAALAQLTRGLAVGMAPEVRVNAVAPGTVASGWHERLVGAEAFEQKAAAEAGQVPLGRVASADDIAEVIASLALSLDFVTGQEIIADGGKALRY